MGEFDPVLSGGVVEILGFETGGKVGEVESFLLLPLFFLKDGGSGGFLRKEAGVRLPGDLGITRVEE